MVASLIPQTLIGNRYELQRSLAHGGMAEVWLAFDLQLNRLVAVKLLRTHTADDPVVAERFRREAHALARLAHPNIVTIYDIVEENNRLYVVMKYIAGKSLRETLDDMRRRNPSIPGTLSPQLTVHIGRSIAFALKHTHDNNIVHRDIKPGNIMLDTDGTILLADFGIAKDTDDEGMTAGIADLTNDNIMMGTAKYLSPELVQGKSLTGRADLYSLGLVLYECLSGDVPFNGPNDQAIAIGRLQRDATPLSTLCPHVPLALTAVIHKMLQRRPEHRYDNGADVAVALQASLAGSPDAQTPAVGLGNGRTGTSTGSSTSVAPNPGQDPLMGQKSAPVVAPTPAPLRDPTPKKAVNVDKGLPPARRSSTLRSLAPAIILVAVAAVMVMFLWRGLRDTKAPAIPTPTQGAAREVAPVDTSPVTVVVLKSYDPNGDDKLENEAMVGALSDNDPATVWTTLCYGDKYFGSKRGVGIVTQLSRSSAGQMTVNMGSAPWSAEIFTSDAGIPDSLKGWGSRVTNGYATQEGVATFNVSSSGTYILLLLREIGSSPTCSASNPFKGVIRDLGFTAA
ncbi:MAG: serine/threonine protein kinase [Ilumatobacteraceae bacterium]|nr:serine/threonine protein kinase [Ilumatobacteraceae bacterium]